MLFRSQQRAYYSGGNDDYLHALRADNQMVGQLKKEKSSEKILPVLRDVAFDMQLKADNCRHSADGLGKEIRVTQARGSPGRRDSEGRAKPPVRSEGHGSSDPIQRRVSADAPRER